MEANLSSELGLTSQWEAKWLVSLMTSKSKHLTCHNNQVTSQFQSIEINVCFLKEAFFLERLFGPILKETSGRIRIYKH